jgi:hypothetical protein
LLLDLVLLLFSFAVVYLVKYGNLWIQEKYVVFFPILVFCWLASGVFSSKFHDTERARIEPLAYSMLYFAGLVSLLIYGLQILSLSRFVVFAGIVVYLLLEVIFISGLILPVFVKREPERRRFSAILLAGETLVISAAFFLLHYIKTNSLIIVSEDYQYILFLIMFLWFFSALFSHGFVIDLSVNFFKMIVPFIKSYFMILSLFSVVVFGFRPDGFSRLLFFGTVLIYATIELLILATIYLARYVHKNDIPEVNIFEAPLLHEDLVVRGVVSREKPSGRYAIPGKRRNSILFSKKLASVYLKNSSAAFEFIDRTVNLKKIDILKSEVMDSGNAYNVEILPDNSLEFLLNRHQLNDFRYLNQYLIQVNRKLENGGVFVGRFEPMERRYIYFRNRYPAFFARVFYVLDFFWKRMCPKLPLLKKIYFLITKGSGRVFSMAQGLGRLYYCGFEVIALEEEKNFVWFAVKKVKEPLETVPSYALFFKQKRVGKGGEPIYIYKIRTMHPFSEFIHQYVFERNQLDEKGKIRDDFRITIWGRVFRKLWIDELPMVLNWLKRDLKLVGVRPLSETFFNTYPEDLQKLRVKSRPGLVPPYYADMPGSIEEVWASERRYLEQHVDHPWRTDWVYFWKALYNIGFKRARSS